MNGEINKHLNHLLSKTSKLEAERASAPVPVSAPAPVSVQPSAPHGSPSAGSGRRPTMGAARMVAQAQKAAAEMSVNELFEITNELDEISSTLSISSSSSSAPSGVEYDPFEIESDLQAEPDANVVANQRTKCFQQTIRKLISDPKGRAWWSSELGGRLMVSWEEWERAMTATGKQGSEFQRLIQTPKMKQKLQLILDQHMTGMVSQMKFGEFLRGFGPFEFCTENVLCVIEAPWFFYFLTSSEAEFLLKESQVGTYLMRFSVSNPGSFALAFLSAPQTILHVLIDNESNNQFSVQGPKKKRHFETLDDILDHYKRLLKQPLSTMMPILDGYHFGELSEEEAEDYLVEATDGSYLLRFQKGTGTLVSNFVLSYRFEDVAYHSIVRTDPSSIGFDGDDEQFPNIQALLQSYGDVLRHPLNASELLSSTKSSSSSSSASSRR
eukprot:TRINITY_DN1117_c0_g2_i4.p1 TRINITY_DN1117_c0_g2~~TRINITY_DN1117_c0_g2_i4.p1  ORF type:complete len:481 (-),score=206.55 TRINITY_DN1117_c0_g2_i4:1050-2369(-)